MGNPGQGPVERGDRVVVVRSLGAEIDNLNAQVPAGRKVLAAQEENVRSGWYYFWDPLAAAVVRDEDLVSFQDLSLEVVLLCTASNTKRIFNCAIF